MEQRYARVLRQMHGKADLTGMALRVRIHDLFRERKGRAMVSFGE